MKKLIPLWFKQLLTEPVTTLSRWQYAVRFFVELCRQAARQLREDRANQMAAALAFRTIFGLIPVIIIATLLFRAFGSGELFGDLIENMLNAANLNDVTSPDESLTLASWARGIVQDIDTNFSGRAVGVVGLLVLGWAAISLLTTIERSFNTICRAPGHRSLMRRIPLYWTTITIGPALLYLSFEFQGRFVELIEQAGWGESLAALLGLATSFLSVWVFLLSLYAFVPHTKVHLGAAAVGSLVATILWTGATHAFGSYIAWSFSKESSPFKILYGSLGLIPLFLLWVYFLWLVVLYGLELATMLKIVRGRLDKGLPIRGEMPPLLEPASVIPLAQVVAERFAKGLTTRAEDVVSVTHFHEQAVDLLLNALAEDGVLHRVDKGGDSTYALARPPDKINTGELLEVAQRLTAGTQVDDKAASGWIASFRAAQLEPALHRPLAEL